MPKLRLIFVGKRCHFITNAGHILDNSIKQGIKLAIAQNDKILAFADLSLAKKILTICNENILEVALHYVEILFILGVI